MQADFSYNSTEDSAGCQLTVTILADRPHIRAEMQEDAQEAGFHVVHCCGLEDFVNGAVTGLGDLVLIDCVAASGVVMALLSRLDMRVGKAGAHLVVSTGIESLDAVFGCFSLSRPQILVDPGRGDRVIAIGRVLAYGHNTRLREMSNEDRMLLLRLTEQVGHIAQQVDRLAPAPRAGGGAFNLESPVSGWRGQGEDYVAAPGQSSVPVLPDAARIRQLIRHRQARARYFDGELFADPAWDILLDLTAARLEGVQVSVSSLCIAASVPATTGLRWITQMVDAGLLRRVQDKEDRRRAFIELTDDTAQAMARYFAEIDAGADRGVPAVVV